MNAPAPKEGFQRTDASTPQPVAAPQIVAAPAPAPAPEPPPPKVEEYKETWPIKVKLVHKPIRDQNNQELKELTFREPTAGDINRCGNPVRLTDDYDAVIDERKMTLIMANLSGVLSPMLDKMDPRDWNSCAYRLRTFFLPEPALAW
jgi:Phage tail assembly chaperone proteins, E, or 41 or 14